MLLTVVVYAAVMVCSMRVAWLATGWVIARAGVCDRCRRPKDGCSCR